MDDFFFFGFACSVDEDISGGGMDGDSGGLVNCVEKLPAIERPGDRGALPA